VTNKLQTGELLRVMITAALCAWALAACGDGKANSLLSNTASSAATSAPTGSSSGTATDTSTTAPSAAPVAAANNTVTMSWQPPLTNTDGSALTDLAGYTIYYGNSAAAISRSVKLPDANILVYTLQGLSTGTWYFTVRAYNAAGVESEPSATASKTIS
jgi:hypothetical protein